MGRHARADGTHYDRKADFEACGCTVVDLHATGISGLPDFLVGCIGANHLVECKDPSTRYGRAGLSQSQTRFSGHWKGGPVYVVETLQDVLDLIAVWRTRKRMVRP